MRKKFFSLSLILIFLLNGCALSENSSPTSDPVSAVMQSSEPEAHYSEESSKTSTPSEPASTQSVPTDTTSKLEDISSSSAQTVVSDIDKPTPASSNDTSDNVKEPSSSAQADVSPQSPVTSEEPASSNTWTPTVYATAADDMEIAKTIVKYINEYRVSKGASPVIQLPGLSEYAKYRSEQLVTNFAHDTNDVRAAATALKYGEYIDPTLYGLDGEPYYRPCAREAIGQAGKIGTIDEVAQHIANIFFKISSHWSYLGSSEYNYIGIGITYAANRWYCDISVSIENNG